MIAQHRSPFLRIFLERWTVGLFGLLAAIVALSSPCLAADVLGLPADSFPPLTGPGALQTQAKITLDKPLTIQSGTRANVGGALAGGAADGAAIHLEGSAGFEVTADGVSARINWTRRTATNGATSTLSSPLVSRIRGPNRSIIAAGAALTIVGDVDALRSGILGFSVSLGPKTRGGCPDLVHYSRGAVVAQTRNYRMTASGKTLHSDCSPDVAAGLWRIERDYRGCDWQPADQDKIYPSYRLVYRPFGDGGPLIQVQGCLPDQQMPSAPFGITIGGCPQIPSFPAHGTGSSVASQRYGWTTPDGVYRALTPCLDQVPVTLNHDRRACAELPKPSSSQTWANPAPSLAGVALAEIYVQTDAGATSFRKLLPCLPWGENIVKEARSCSGQFYDDMAGGVSFPMVTYSIQIPAANDNASDRTIPISGCLPDPQQVIIQDERQVGWSHADGVQASFPLMQRTRSGVDIGQPHIGDPAQAYQLEADGVVNAGATEVVGCITYQARQRVTRYRRPDDTFVDLLGLYEPPVVNDTCGR